MNQKIHLFASISIINNHITHKHAHIHSHPLATQSFVSHCSTNCCRNESSRHQCVDRCTTDFTRFLTRAFSISRIVGGHWMQEKRRKTGDGRIERRREREKARRKTRPFFKPLNNRPRSVPMPSHPSACLLLPLLLLLHQVATLQRRAQRRPLFRACPRSHVRGTANKRQSSERLPLFILIIPLPCSSQPAIQPFFSNLHPHLRSSTNYVELRRATSRFVRVKSYR